MNKEDLKYCLYYKGEQECPKPNNQNFYGFWQMENMYWNNSPMFRKEYEQKALEYMKNNPNVDNFLTSYAPLEQKGFVLYAEDYLRSWYPQAVDMVFDYGKVG